MVEVVVMMVEVVVMMVEVVHSVLPPPKTVGGNQNFRKICCGGGEQGHVVAWVGAFLGGKCKISNCLWVGTKILAPKNFYTDNF